MWSDMRGPAVQGRSWGEGGGGGGGGGGGHNQGNLLLKPDFY